MTSRRLQLAILLLVIALVAVIGLGVLVAQNAANRALPAISESEASTAEMEARLFWDNPFQRMFYVALRTTGVRRGASCPTFTVTAYALFGAPIDLVFVNCEGVKR